MGKKVSLGRALEILAEMNYRLDNGLDEPMDDDDIPVGCRACGGDYPNCADSCPIFDD